MEQTQKEIEPQKIEERFSETEFSGVWLQEESLDPSLAQKEAHLKKRQESETIYFLQKKYQRGVEVLCNLEKQSLDKLVTQDPTKKYFVLHYGNGEEIDYVLITEQLRAFGKFSLIIFPGLCYGLLEFETLEHSQQLRNQLQTIKGLEPSFYKTAKQNNRDRVIFLLPTSQELQDIQRTKNNDIPNATRVCDQVPGLLVFPDFITAEEEQWLIEKVDKNEWQKLAKRRVQHYGFEFLYGVNTVDKQQSAQKVQPIPEFAYQITERINEITKEANNGPMDQLTINDYFPGQGIAPHFDTHSPFEEHLAVLSLLNGIVMCWKSHDGKTEHNVYLPNRSLLIMTGEARYAWFHSIATRKLDKVDNQFVFRRRRVSLTYRRIKNSPCQCKFPFFCDSQGYDPVQMKKLNPLLPKDISKDEDTTKIVKPKSEEETKLLENCQNNPHNDSRPTEIEKKYVYDVYDRIAPHFSHTRYKPWPRVVQFLKSLEDYSLVADVGCGNGKYLDANPNVQVIGIDRSINLIELAKARQNTFQVIAGDSLKLAFRNDSFDHAISIAVVHHFSTSELRIKALQELKRIVKVKGKILVYVWALEQEEKAFSEQDVFVPWNLHFKYEELNSDKGQAVDTTVNIQKQAVVYKRYYHVFKKDELEALILTIPGVSILESFFDHANWCCVIQKDF